MRLLMNVTIPHDPFNTAVRDGSVGETLERMEFPRFGGRLIA